MPKNNIYTKSFYWRNGLKIMPSQNFVDKFKEIYNELLYNSKSRAKCKPLDDQTAIFFINIVLETIITILDFGYTFWWSKMMILTPKIVTCHLGTEYAPKRIYDNVKKLNFRLFTTQEKKVRAKVNKDNKEYMEYIENKKNRFNDIKNYYKEFYGKENDWWKESDIS